ncbi:hypothetical protein lerEdw1_010660 [Lerista edwardsae]|nr:hypothetical protein lerEdw1_010660 [Lerista edwardsae]
MNYGMDEKEGFIRVTNPVALGRNALIYISWCCVPRNIRYKKQVDGGLELELLEMDDGGVDGISNLQLHQPCRSGLLGYQRSFQQRRLNPRNMSSGDHHQQKKRSTYSAPAHQGPEASRSAETVVVVHGPVSVHSAREAPHSQQHESRSNNKNQKEEKQEDQHH